MSDHEKVRGAVLEAVPGQHPLGLVTGGSRGLNHLLSRPSVAALGCYADRIVTAVIPLKLLGKGKLEVETFGLHEIMSVEEGQGQRAMNFFEQKNSTSIVATALGGVGDLTEYSINVSTVRGDFRLTVDGKRLGELRPVYVAIASVIQ